MFGKLTSRISTWRQNHRHPEEFEGIVTDHYEGSVISADYNVKDPYEYRYHSLVPHGKGRIVYTRGGEVVEEYEGEFNGGQYSGQGKLFKNGEVFEGEFEGNFFIPPEGVAQDDQPADSPYSHASLMKKAEEDAADKDVRTILRKGG